MASRILKDIDDCTFPGNGGGKQSGKKQEQGDAAAEMDDADAAGKTNAAGAEGASNSNPNNAGGVAGKLGS